MFSAETLAGLSQKLDLVVQGFSLMLPELLVMGLLVLGIFAELFIHGKSEKSSSSWRYFISLLGLLFVLALAFQRLKMAIMALPPSLYFGLHLPAMRSIY